MLLTMPFDFYKPFNKVIIEAIFGCERRLLVKPEGQNKDCFHNRKPQLLEVTFSRTCVFQYIHKQSGNR